MPQPNYNIITFDFHSKWEIDELNPNYLNHIYWIDIYIDGVDLKQLVIEYTNKYFEQEETIAAYDEFWLEWMVGSLGIEENTGYTKKGDLICCSCGSHGCYSIMCTIVEKKDKVIWKNFTDLNKADYKIPELVFEKEQYTNELNKLKAFYDNADFEPKDRYYWDENDELVEFIPEGFIQENDDTTNE